MKGLRVVNYYKKILNNYSLSMAMEDSLCFESNSNEAKGLTKLAETSNKRMLSTTCLNYVELLSYNKHEYYDYLLFVKMLADVLNNINNIKKYLSTHKNVLKYHRPLIIPGILNMDFLREGNFVRIGKIYYNLEIIFYVMTNKTHDYQSLYNYIVTYTEKMDLDSESMEYYRKSIYSRYTDSIHKDIPAYKSLSISKTYEEIISLLCMNTHYNEIIVHLCMRWSREQSYLNRFKWFFPMTLNYKDLFWIQKKLDFYKTKTLKNDIYCRFPDLKLERKIDDFLRIKYEDFPSISPEMLNVNKNYMHL